MKVANISLTILCSHCRQEMTIKKDERDSEIVSCQACGQRYNVKVIRKADGVAIFVDKFGIPMLSHYHNDGSGFHHR